MTARTRRRAVSSDGGVAGRTQSHDGVAGAARFFNSQWFLSKVELAASFASLLANTSSAIAPNVFAVANAPAAFSCLRLAEGSMPAARGFRASSRLARASASDTMGRTALTEQIQSSTEKWGSKTSHTFIRLSAASAPLFDSGFGNQTTAGRTVKAGGVWRRPLSTMLSFLFAAAAVEPRIGRSGGT